MRILLLVLFTFLVSIESTGQGNKLPAKKDSEKAKVTFVELGSVKCIPCKQMQPVMKAIEERYGEQIKVVFYDVWLPEQKQYAQKFGIKLIPTQVFLDEKGEEFHRHEGFYPEKEIDKILISKGLKPITGKN
ncbi:MAG: thioredoxin [Ignavibacteriae bacterium HGW-Ignavibacteriae-2]|jgi:thioredoxin 1|nr:MAG: thioredoxin [Ignavibacteriae bacterium HGW-Ignavibacteriae-2]